MSEKKYIIRYKFGSINKEKFIYLTIITDYHTYSVIDISNPHIMKMTLKEAKNNATKIKKIYKQTAYNVREIGFINIKTGEINNYKPKKITRFELMEI